MEIISNVKHRGAQVISLVLVDRVPKDLEVLTGRLPGDFMVIKVSARYAALAAQELWNKYLYGQRQYKKIRLFAFGRADLATRSLARIIDSRSVTPEVYVVDPIFDVRCLRRPRPWEFFSLAPRAQVVHGYADVVVLTARSRLNTCWVSLYYFTKVFRLSEIKSGTHRRMASSGHLRHLSQSSMTDIVTALESFGAFRQVFGWLVALNAS